MHYGIRSFLFVTLAAAAAAVCIAAPGVINNTKAVIGGAGDVFCRDTQPLCAPGVPGCENLRRIWCDMNGNQQNNRKCKTVFFNDLPVLTCAIGCNPVNAKSCQ